MKRCTNTEFFQLLQQDSHPAQHLPAAPNTDGYKDRERMRMPDTSLVALSSQIISKLPGEFIGKLLVVN